LKPQAYHPLAYPGEELKVRVNDLRINLLNMETIFTLKIVSQPFVYKIEPSYAFGKVPGVPIRVYVP
jgi:hypothetical protein